MGVFSKSVNVSRDNGIPQGVGVGSEVGLIGQEKRQEEDSWDIGDAEDQ